MLIILPIATLILFGYYLLKSKTGIREAILSAFLLWSCCLVVITEVLSFFKIINLPSISIAWVSILGGLACLCFRINKNKLNISKIDFKLVDLLFLGAILFIGAVLLVIAFFAAPNNSDSMNYHMARVPHWIQNMSIQHYPTHISQQLYQPPFAEWVILHFQILNGSDRFANSVQWLFMIGSVLAVSLIIKEIGYSIRSQIVGALLTICIPMGLLQATSTQNDWVVTYWIVTLIYFIVKMQTKIEWKFIMASSSALGLALLTKATAYIFAAPFLIWFSVLVYKHEKWRSWKKLIVFGSLALAINAPHFFRNYEIYHSPLGGHEGQYSNEKVTVPYFISNLARNIGSQLIIPKAKNVNQITRKIITAIHRRMGIKENEAEITWTGTYFSTDIYLRDDNMAPNPWHLLLIVVSLASLFFYRNQRKNSRILITYGICILTAFLLFNGYLKWQPWHSRLLLPLLVSSIPLCASFLGRSGKNNYSQVIAVIFLLFSIPWLFNNQTRSFIGKKNIFYQKREKQYFNSRPKLELPFRKIANFINKRKYTKIGLCLEEADWEYPYWVLINPQNNPRIQIEHVKVKNYSAIKYHERRFGNFKPQVIIVNSHVTRVRQ